MSHIDESSQEHITATYAIRDLFAEARQLLPSDRINLAETMLFSVRDLIETPNRAFVDEMVSINELRIRRQAQECFERAQQEEQKAREQKELLILKMAEVLQKADEAQPPLLVPTPEARKHAYRRIVEEVLNSNELEISFPTNGEVR